MAFDLAKNRHIQFIINPGYDVWLEIADLIFTHEKWFFSIEDYETWLKAFGPEDFNLIVAIDSKINKVIGSLAVARFPSINGSEALLSNLAIDDKIQVLNLDVALRTLDFGDIVRFDMENNGGVNREKYLTAWLTAPNSVSAKIAVDKNEKVVGIVSIRTSMEKTNIGVAPLIAKSPEVAATLLRRALESVKKLDSYKQIFFFPLSDNQVARKVYVKLTVGTIIPIATCQPMYTLKSLPINHSFTFQKRPTAVHECLVFTASASVTLKIYKMGSTSSFPANPTSQHNSERERMAPQKTQDPDKLTAKDFKERGNRLYQAQRYDEAIVAYSSAIVRDNTEATYFTNRALCHIQIKKWEQAESDCRRALELDPKHIKANYLLGKACIHFKRYDEAIKVLARANEYAANQKISFGDDITLMLRQARRERFRIEEDKRLNQEIELQSYLNRLIDDDLDKNLEKVTKESEDKNEDEIEVKKDQIRNEACRNKEILNNLFAQVDKRRQKREIPDYLCGKISFELLKDPVITPSGITYDRSDIKEHLHRVGHFDPVTRVPLTVDQLIPNLAMKEVLDAFISENEWALDA
uniref:U-box domain-containing protein n=1 Tax=Panagrolaimus sp. JU765 TaxID=591449 RepID=A0AC34RJK2_9BILA